MEHRTATNNIDRLLVRAAKADVKCEAIETTGWFMHGFKVTLGAACALVLVELLLLVPVALALEAQS